MTPHDPEQCWKFILHERELREQWQGSHEYQHKMENDERSIAKRDMDRRLEEMNQFREQISRERGEFVRRDLHDKLEKDVDTRLKLMENAKSNLEGRLLAMGAIITAVIAGVQVALHFLVK